MSLSLNPATKVVIAVVHKLSVAGLRSNPAFMATIATIPNVAPIGISLPLESPDAQGFQKVLAQDVMHAEE